MAYSSLAAPSPFSSKYLFKCLKVLDEEDSSDSGSPRMLLDTKAEHEGLKASICSPTQTTQRSQRRTTTCSLQALSRSSKKMLPRMSFSSPNVMRGKLNKRPQTEKAKRGDDRNLSNVKIDMLNVLLDSKNEEVTTLKSMLQQSEQRVFTLETKVASLEDENKLQNQILCSTPPIADLSCGSDSEYNTDHDSQTMPYIPEVMLEDLTSQLHDKEQEIEELVGEVEEWQKETNEWKNKYLVLLEQMQNGAVSDDEEEEGGNTASVVNFGKHNDEFGEDYVGESGAEKDNDNENSNLSIDGDRDNNNSEENIENYVSINSPVGKRSLRNRIPLGESQLQNVQTPIKKTSTRKSRRRKKTMRYTPTTNVNNKPTNTGEEEAPKEDGTDNDDVEFGEVGYKFRKYFGSRYGSYDGEVTDILPDGKRVCAYPADPDGVEYLTLDELSKTKPLRLPRHEKAKSSTSKNAIGPLQLDGEGKNAVLGMMQVKRNTTCHIW